MPKNKKPLQEWLFAESVVGERGFEPPAPASRTRSQALQTRYLLIKTPVNQGFTMQQRAAECNNVPNFLGLLEQDWSTDSVAHPATRHANQMKRGFHGPSTYTRLWTLASTMTEPYSPITKEMAAEILNVSKRTIDNWLADGSIVPPHNIGRRIYWHPQ
ncbi:helix-turn-helix domain-containing protein, partial [Zoogloea sp.]|uniref:helix-turn-helix domain-containing protein n=1 Tax=Zoogloea sp. TaxID=49181 RepID=UPI0025EDA7E0